MSSVGETSAYGWIAYEPSKGDMTILNGSFTSPADSQSWIWGNMSHSLHTALQQTDIHFAAPFAFESSSIISASTFKNGTYSKLALEVDLDSLPMFNSSLGEYKCFHEYQNFQDIDLR